MPADSPPGAKGPCGLRARKPIKDGGLATARAQRLSAKNALAGRLIPFPVLSCGASDGRPPFQPRLQANKQGVGVGRKTTSRSQLYSSTIRLAP